MAGSQIRWKQHVAIENNPNSVYNIDDYKPKKKKFKLKLPRGYSPGDNVSKDQAKKIIRYATMKLDWDLLALLLDDRRFTRSHLSLEHLEIIVGKALISGHLKKVKKMFKKAKSIDKYKSLSVTDAFFHDLISRKKKSVQKFNGLVLMTVIRQGNHEALKFCLDNISEETNIHEVHVQDGDMIFSLWAKHREFHELTPAEKLAEVIPKDKIFDSFFEQETPLTAVVKNQESMKEVDKNDKESMLTLLLRVGANPYAENYQAFKVAAKHGLIKEIEMMLKHMRPVNGNPKARANFSRHVKDIYTNVLAYAATENQRMPMYYVHGRLDGTKKSRNDKNSNKKLQIGIYIEKAIQKLVRHGASEHCTFRYRILNGIYNLMRMKHRIETEEAQRIRDNQSSALEFPAAQPEKLKGPDINQWKKSATSSLACNDVVDYDGAHKELGGPNVTQFGAVLNRAFNVSLAAQTINLNFDGGASVRSGRSYSTASSQSRTGRGRKKTLVKPNMMYKWLLFILQKNDYNGEKMGQVLMNLGLRPYIGKRRVKKRNSSSNQSETGSAWDMESNKAESVIDDEPEDTEVASEKSGGSEAPGWGLGGRKSSRPGRRRSTLTNVAMFFKDVSNNVASKIGNKDKISSKEKVLILEAAAEFGSHPIMEELLSLIAPELNATVLKCCFLATIGEKVLTQKLLLDRVTKEIEKVLKGDDSDEEGDAKKGMLTKSKLTISSRSLRGSGRSNATVENYIAAFLDYKDKVDAINDLNRKKQALKNRKLVVGQAKSTLRKSISAIGNSARRLSQGAVDLVKVAFGRKKSQSQRSKFRKSFSRNRRKKGKQDEKLGIQKALKKNRTMGKRKGAPNELHQKALNNAKKHEFNVKGKKSLFRSVESLENQMAEFLVGLVEAAGLHGSFDCAENTMKNPFARKDDCKRVIVHLLKEYCGIRQRRRKDAERYLNGYINLITNHMSKKEANIPQVARDVLDEATKADTRDLNNFTYVLNKLSEVYGKKFLTLEDLMFCIERSIEANRDWELWPKFLKLVFLNLSEGESANIDRLPKMIKKKKLRSKLKESVRTAIDHICGADKGDHAGHKSMKGMFSNARKSLRRRRSSRDKF